MRKTISAIVLLLLFGLVLTPAQAQDDRELREHPSYVDFEDIDIPENPEETVEVYVSRPLLRLIAHAASRDDPALAGLLSKLLLVKMNAFSIDSETTQDLREKIVKIGSSLHEDRWERAVWVKDPDELVNIYLKTEDSRILGLVVMVAGKDGKAAFVNIVGEIDLDAIGRLGPKFGIPKLDSLGAAEEE